MSLRNVQRSKSGTSILFEKAVTLAPILSHKSRNTRDFPFSTTLETRKQETSNNEFNSILNNRLDKNWRSLKECLERVQKKRSLQIISQNIEKSQHNKKQMFSGKQQSKLKAKGSLGHFVKRSNGLLPCRYGIANRRDIFISKTEISEQKRQNIKQRKQLSEKKMSSKKHLSKLLSLNKIQTNLINKIRCSSIGINESIIEQNLHVQNQISIDKKIKDEINKVSICLAKGNHKSLRDKVKIKQNCFQSKIPYFTHKISQLNISLFNTENNQQIQNQSLGLCESVIQSKQIQNNFVQQTDRQFLNQIQLPFQNRLNKKIWKRLPCDFLNIN